MSNLKAVLTLSLYLLMGHFGQPANAEGTCKWESHIENSGPCNNGSPFEADEMNLLQVGVAQHQNPRALSKESQEKENYKPEGNKGKEPEGFGGPSDKGDPTGNKGKEPEGFEGPSDKEDPTGLEQTDVVERLDEEDHDAEGDALEEEREKNSMGLMAMASEAGPDCKREMGTCSGRFAMLGWKSGKPLLPYKECIKKADPRGTGCGPWDSSSVFGVQPPHGRKACFKACKKVFKNTWSGSYIHFDLDPKYKKGRCSCCSKGVQIHGKEFGWKHLYKCTQPPPQSEDCGSLPQSMNGHDKPKGCPGAVWFDDSPSWRYCTSDKYPWWKACCEWSDNQCKPKST